MFGFPSIQFLQSETPPLTNWTLRLPRSRTFLFLLPSFHAARGESAKVWKRRTRRMCSPLRLPPLEPWTSVLCSPFGKERTGAERGGQGRESQQVCGTDTNGGGTSLRQNMKTWIHLRLHIPAPDFTGHHLTLLSLQKSPDETCWRVLV